MARWLVRPNVIGGWDVLLEGGASHAARVSSRRDGEDAARQLAAPTGGEVVVLDAAGAVLSSFVVAASASETPESIAVRAALKATDKLAEGKSPAEIVKAHLEEQADEVIDAGFQGWWARADGDQRFAARVLIGAALLGPIGATLITVVQTMAHPKASTQIIQALFWLVVLTLPILAACLVLALHVGHGPFAVTLMLAAAAAVFGAYLVGKAEVPQTLGELYCYADVTTNGAVYENQCRVMDTRGFVDRSTQQGITASSSPVIIGTAFTLVADSRGLLMALCGVAAGVSGGYLVRRESGS